METSKSRVLALAEPVAAGLGLEVLEVEFGGDDARRLVRVYLDSADADRAVSVDDCAKAGRLLGDVLDANEALAGDYMLEVSSPGLNRPLRKREHFERVVGGRIKVRTAAGQDGRRNFVGRLQAVDGQVLSIIGDDEREFRVGLADIDKANFQYKFDEPAKPGVAPKRKRSKK